LNNEATRRARYKELSAVVRVAIPGLISALNKGAKTILITRDLIDDLDPKNLALVGTVVAVCQVYEATVIFTAWTERLAWVRDRWQTFPPLE
jgi:hypothetical protein